MFLDLQFSADVEDADIFNHPDSQHTCSLLIEDSSFPEQFGMISQVTSVYYENPCFYEKFYFRQLLSWFSIINQKKKLQIQQKFGQ